MLLESRRPGEPSYRLLARTLREQILSDRFGDDEPLPTELALADRHGLSRQTVRRAYLELVTEGLIFRVPGRGTFVTPKQARYLRTFGSVEDLMNLTLDTELEVVTPLTGMFHAEAAERLKVTQRSLYSVSFRRRHRGEVFCSTVVYLPPWVGSSLEDVPELCEVGRTSRATVIGLIESRGISIVEADQVISAVAADRDAARLLGCPTGAPLLHVERLYIGPSGHPVELAVTDFLPEHYAHRLRLGRGNPYIGDPASEAGLGAPTEPHATSDPDRRPHTR